MRLIKLLKEGYLKRKNEGAATDPAEQDQKRKNFMAKRRILNYEQPGDDYEDDFEDDPKAKND